MITRGLLFQGNGAVSYMVIAFCKMYQTMARASDSAFAFHWRNYKVVWRDGVEKAGRTAPKWYPLRECVATNRLGWQPENLSTCPALLLARDRRRNSVFSALRNLFSLNREITKMKQCKPESFD